MRSVYFLVFMFFFALVSCVTSSPKTETPAAKAAILGTRPETCENSNYGHCVYLKRTLDGLNQLGGGLPINLYIRGLQNALKDENSGRVKALADSLETDHSELWGGPLTKYLIEMGLLSDSELIWLLNSRDMSEQKPKERPKQLELENEL